MEEVEVEILGEDLSGDIAIEGTPPSSRSRSPERLIEETVDHPEKDGDDIVQGECTSNSNKILTNECAIREERMEETKQGKKERLFPVTEILLLLMMMLQTPMFG